MVLQNLAMDSLRCTKKVGRVNTHQSSCNGLTYNNLYITSRFPASFLPFLVLPEELRGREPSELEQYALLVEVPHGLVNHLGGLVRRHPVEPAEASLEVAEVALDDGVVVAAAPAGHAPHHPVLAGEAQVLPAPVQPAPVAVDHHPARHAPPPLQALQHLPDHLPRVAPGHAVRQHHVAVQVHYRGQVQPPAAEDTHLRHVRHQLLQRGGGSELPVQQVGGVSGAASAPPAALAAVGAHQPH